MTQNQIRYQDLLETMRANRAKESETNRSNLAGEALRAQELAEQSRHNYATEIETNRSNVARENETSRHNVRDEALRAESNSLEAYRNLETSLHNRVMEGETERSNLAKEAETNRSNLAKEALEASRQKLDSVLTHFKEDMSYTKHVQSLEVDKSRIDKQYESSMVSTLGGALTNAVKSLVTLMK